MGANQELSENLAFLYESHDGTYGVKELVDKIINALKEYREEKEKRLREGLFADITVKKIGVFISYHYDADSEVAKTITQMVNNDKTNPFIVMEEGVKTEDEKAIKHWIDETMQKTRITILLFSDKTMESQYVTYELEKSLSEGKLLVTILIDSKESKINEEDAVEKLRKLNQNAYDEKIGIKKWYRDNGKNNIVKWLNGLLQTSES